MPKSPSRGSLFAIFLTVFIDLLGFGMVLPLLAIYAKAFAIDSTGWVIGLLVACFSIMQFVFAPVWGRISDSIGRRPVILIGLAGSTIFYATFGVAAAMQSLVGLFVARIGAGISGATISTAQAYIADSTTTENRTKGMALIGAAFGLGFTFGPLLAAAALLSTENNVAQSPWPGYVAAAISGCAFVFAFFKLPESKSADCQSTHKRLFDLVSFRRALAVPTIGALLLVSFAGQFAFANFEGVLPLVLKNSADEGGFGYELTRVLMFFALLGFVHALAQGMVRGLASRFSETKLAAGGAAVGAIGFVVLAWATHAHSFPLFLAGMIVEGMGFAFI
ncbi:MAG: MFS transporter, partial [Planctomycetaceae bacterium]|nr:MFS transporter [Planctomycetaceae bacterium]